MFIDQSTKRQYITVTWLWVVALLAALCVLVPGCEAQRHVDAGLSAWEQGDAPKARYHLEQARAIDASAVDEPAVQETLRLATRDSELLLAQRAEGQERWAQAVDHSSKAVAADPRHELAQRALAENRERYIRQLFDTAIEQANEGGLDGAALLLKQVLKQQSDHAEALDALASLEPGVPAPAAAAQARSAAEQGDWQRAALLLGEAVRDAPLHLPTRAARHALNGRAATDLHDRGQSALQAGDLSSAVGFFKEIQQYRPRDVRTRRGLADVALRRADDAYAQQRPGLAWLHARAALSHVKQDPAALERIERSAGLLAAEHQPTIEVQSQSTGTNGHDSVALTERIRDGLSGSSLVAVASANDSVNGSTAMSPMHTVVTLRVESVLIDAQQVSRQTRTHHYDVLEDRPNPELSVLAHRVSSEAHELSALSSQERRLCAELSRAEAAGDLGLVASLRSKLHDLQRRVRHAEGALRSAQHALDCAPAYITVRRTLTRPYTVELHRLVGSLTGVYRTNDADWQAFAAQADAEDATTLDPDPSIGLAVDPLTLPTPAKQRGELIESAAAEVSSRLGVETRRAAVDRLLDAVSNTDADADSGVAIERATAAAALLRPMDGKGAEAILAPLDARVERE